MPPPYQINHYTTTSFTIVIDKNHFAHTIDIVPCSQGLFQHSQLGFTLPHHHKLIIFDIFMIIQTHTLFSPNSYLYCNCIMDNALPRPITTHMDNIILPPDFNSLNLNESQRSLSHHCPERIFQSYTFISIDQRANPKFFFENSRLSITICTISH